MIEASTLTGALGSLKAASDIVRGINAANLGIEKAELKLRVAELADLLVDARTAVVEAQEQILALRSEVAALRTRDADRSKLRKKDNVYYFATAEGEEGPFCPRCFETSNARMPVSRLSITFQGLGTFKCPECKAVF